MTPFQDWLKGCLLLGIAAAVLAGCSRPESEANKEFPPFAYGSALSLEGYRTAVAIPSILEQLPCYCGCGKTVKHKNLKECFIKPDSSYDEHASGCDLCVKEALDASSWNKEGKGIKEIRAMIESKYREYGPPTDTPPL